MSNFAETSPLVDVDPTRSEQSDEVAMVACLQDILDTETADPDLFQRALRMSQILQAGPIDARTVAEFLSELKEDPALMRALLRLLPGGLKALLAETIRTSSAACPGGPSI